MHTRPCGPHTDLPWLGLVHDGANRSANKLRRQAGLEGKLPTRTAAPARRGDESLRLLPCGAGTGEGFLVLAGPVCGTSAWSLTVTEARSCRGAEFEATDRDSRGQPTRPLGLSPSSSRATPTESEEVMSSDNPTQSPQDAKHKAGNDAAGRWFGAHDGDP